jgi:hypothetical protein
MTLRRLPRYVDRQFVSSFLLTIAFYSTLLAALLLGSWWLEKLAALGLFAFLLWAYRWPIGEKLGLCRRRPGALPPQRAQPAAGARDA